MHRGKVDPGVSELPRGNELSRDHLNRPLEREDNIFCEMNLHCIVTAHLALFFWE